MTAEPDIVEEPVHDLVEAPEDVGLVHRDPVLALQHMEAALVRADLEAPDVLSPEEFRRLRYLLSFARLTTFEPGAALGKRGRGDVQVDLTQLRERVVGALHGPLRELRGGRARLEAGRAIAGSLQTLLEETREALPGNEFSRAELDAEVGYKSLVCVLGGGGGSGYVYLGGMQAMLAAGLVPALIVANSFGSIVGSVTSRALPVPIADYIEWSKTVRYGSVLGPESRRRRHGMPGVFALRFDAFADPVFRFADGTPMRLQDTAIPFEVVVAGVRRQSFDRLPSRFRRTELASLGLRALPGKKPGAAAFIAARMWQVGAFIDSRVVKPIVLGGDPLTEQLNVVDAVSFSASVPGVLHHESRDPQMWPLLDQLLADKDVAALVDGGAASNVPAELAYKRVRDGRLGTRNVCVVAWDCLHPQWNPRHLWLQPITQAVALQMVRNAPYADRVVKFSPTLAATSLAPPPALIDRAMGWGAASAERTVPFVARMLEPVWWDTELAPRKHPKAHAKRLPDVQELLEAAPQPPRATIRSRIWRAKRSG